ncbi:TetR/AcrR family transcriptional regulator [Kutzneria buriramensis]|uniref:AcrR family transcriptional regulator n=1 Tax=Kutzneria buriramensis TaxID=1045776 RepID=A0A3E0GYQ5_9PSEU|nr:TetR/AcrR family transcriptional regulator [Kutzneria buriramensis]REH32937.1 AcrR family transcriptional regulator [Kutzneria buriramensis]
MTEPRTPGLRERKKLAAMEALRHAAFELFARQGFEQTSVDDIAERAEVSRASFFRYFNAKEDVLNFDDDQRREAFGAELAARGDEPVLDALRAAVKAHVAGMDETTRARTVEYARLMMMGSRTLLGQAYEIRIKWLRLVETQLRERLAGRADVDLVAPQLADLAVSVLETSMRLVSLDTDRDFDEIVDRGFALLTFE